MLPLITLLELFVTFFPVRTVIAPNTFAVLFRSKRDPVVRHSVAFWYWPYRTEMIKVLRCSDPTELGEQTMVTKDGIDVTFVSVMSTRVFDPVAATVETEEIAVTTLNIASVVTARYINATDYEDLKTGLAEMDLLFKCNEMSEKYGVEFERLDISQFAKTRNFRVFGIPQQGE